MYHSGQCVSNLFIATTLVFTSESIDEIVKCDHSKVIEQNFSVVLFVLLCAVILTFDSVTGSLTI